MENSYLQHSKKKIIYTNIDLDLKESFLTFTANIDEADLIIQQAPDSKEYLLKLKGEKDLTLSKENLIHFLSIYQPEDTKGSASSFSFWTKSQVPKAIHIIQHAHDKSSLKDLIQSLHDHNYLRDFGDFYILIQTKGEATARQVFIGSKSNEKVVSAEVFNEIFNHIKKSKQVSFASSTDKNHLINIAGTSLAKCYRLQTHNLILIATKNEFIPYAEEIIEDYNNFCEYNKLTFSLLLEKEYLNYLKSSLNKVQETVESNDFSMEDKDNFHQKRIQLLGELLNTLRHELSNPLFGLQLTNSIVSEEFSGEDKELCDQIQLSIEKALKIINNFLWLYNDSEELQTIEVEQLLKEVFTLTKSSTKSIKKDIKIAEELKIQSSPAWLTQIFFNLIINSAQAMERAHTVSPEIRVYTKVGNDKIQIYFQDNGPGINPSNEDNLFSPFYTTKDTGTGLGLAICQNLAQKLNGIIRCAKNDNGALFILELPYEGPAHRG